MSNEMVQEGGCLVESSHAPIVQPNGKSQSIFLYHVKILNSRSLDGKRSYRHVAVQVLGRGVLDEVASFSRPEGSLCPSHYHRPCVHHPRPLCHEGHGLEPGEQRSQAKLSLA